MKMNVKGTGLITTRTFVKTKFPDKYQTWLNMLPEDTRKIFSGVIDVSKWYDAYTCYTIPVNKIAELFYNSNTKEGAIELGRFSADYALKGLYKVFLIISSPAHLMKKASKIISTYYSPSDCKAIKSGPKEVTLKLLDFPEINPLIEYRVAGWCQRALELAKCKDVEYKITQSTQNQDELKTEIVFNWN
jgi:hypothetical protein